MFRRKKKNGGNSRGVNGFKQLMEHQSKALLGSFGIAAGMEELAHTEKEALAVAEK